MLVEITEEQLRALQDLSDIGEYYIEDKKYNDTSYKSDSYAVTQAQEVIEYIQQQFWEVIS
jgi:hypothetical protein